MHFCPFFISAHIIQQRRAPMDKRKRQKFVIFTLIAILCAHTFAVDGNAATTRQAAQENLPQEKPRSFFERIGVEEGLSHNSVMGIVQDKIGFIWVGTKNGLCRYDGYDFVIFQTNPSGERYISDNNIMSICLDSAGFVWVATWSGGVNRINVVSGETTVFQHNPADVRDCLKSHFLANRRTKSRIIASSTNVS
jgi:hypothetical protein